MILALVALSVQSNPVVPMPPYKRVATVQVFDQSYEPIFEVKGSRFYGAASDQCFAYNLNTLKLIWKYTAPKHEDIRGIAFKGDAVYVMTGPGYEGTTAHVVCLNQQTGKVQWSISHSGKGSAMAVVGSDLICSLKAGSISRLDIATRKPKWTTVLSKGSLGNRMARGYTALVASADGVVANEDSVSFGLDARTGRLRWTEANSYVFHGTLPVYRDIAWVPNGEGSVGRSMVTGKIVWSSTASYGDFGGGFGTSFVGIDHGAMKALDALNGHVRWSRSIGPDGTTGGNQYGSVLGNRLFACGIGTAAIFDPSGKVLWTTPSKQAYPMPCWCDDLHIVAFDGLRLTRYIHGSQSALPSDSASRKTLANQLIAEYDHLDKSDVQRLEELGDDAFEPVLSLFLKTCASHDALGDKGDSFPLYSKYHDLGEILQKVTTRKAASGLLKALEASKPKSSAKPELLGLLAKYGDPAIITPYFLKEIQGFKTPGFEMYESNTFVAREYIIRSTDPRAVEFMLNQLRDPKADLTLREAAYVNLAATGGEEGLRTILSMRHHRALLRPLAERVISGYLNAGEFGTSTKVVGEKTATDGRHWGLLQSGILGNSGDLWIAEKVDGLWTSPYFTGASFRNEGRMVKNNRKELEERFEGKTVKELVAGAWFEAFVTNQTIRLDADGDGLTDLVERRLGTDPKKADSDGDGDPDGVDPCPNAAGEPQTDLGKVLAAAFEARFHFNNSDGPALITMPSEMQPFEFIGRNGPVLWTDDKHFNEFQALRDSYGSGIALISFHSGDPIHKVDTKPTKWEDQMVTWNKERTEASFILSTYFGGLNGTGYRCVVRKFGNDWVVVDMHMEYVS